MNVSDATKFFPRPAGSFRFVTLATITAAVANHPGLAHQNFIRARIESRTQEMRDAITIESR
jgi:hypothetical protein